MMELVQEECLLPVHLGVVLLHIAAGVELLLVQRPVVMSSISASIKSWDRVMSAPLPSSFLPLASGDWRHSEVGPAFCRDRVYYSPSSGRKRSQLLASSS